MFKKTLLTVLLFSILLESSPAEESNYFFVEDEQSPIVQCDEAYNDCAEKCGESLPNKCIEKCQLNADQCYNNALSESEAEEESALADME